MCHPGSVTPPTPVRGSYGRVITDLGRRICVGDISPSSPLEVAALEAEYGVRRGVVRETLRVLAAKGLIQSVPRRGTFVSPRDAWGLLDPDILRWRFEGVPDAGFLKDLNEVRAAVEPAVARLAATKRTLHDLAALEDALVAMRAAEGQDSEAHVESDSAFHTALLRAAHNELLQQMAVVIEVGLRVRDKFVHSALSKESTLEHEQVFDAIQHRRPRAAETAMQTLLKRSADDVLRALSLAEEVDDVGVEE
jgi:DNA-binding FadR family transcriptional regulator